jgi:hypothetical protein
MYVERRSNNVRILPPTALLALTELLSNEQRQQLQQQQQQQRTADETLDAIANGAIEFETRLAAACRQLIVTLLEYVFSRFCMRKLFAFSTLVP